MADARVNYSLLAQLEAMGFSLPRATKALHSSGNSSIEDAITWLIDHENDEEIDEAHVVPVNINIEETSSSSTSEQFDLNEQELRNQERRRKEEEAKKLEREREKERIRAGKELQEAKRLMEEQERKRLAAQREAEKEEERRAKEKILQKLQQDKLERRRRLGLPAEAPTPNKPIMPVVQDKKSFSPADSAALPVKSAPKADLMSECLRSLKHRHKDEDIKVKRAFQTLLIYVSNVINNPDQGRFRKIRLSNPAFQARVGIFKEGIEFLELCGFERDEGGKYLILPRDKVDISVLKLARSVLHSAITNPFFGLLSRNAVVED